MSPILGTGIAAGHVLGLKEYQIIESIKIEDQMAEGLGRDRMGRKLVHCRLSRWKKKRKVYYQRELWLGDGAISGCEDSVKAGSRRGVGAPKGI